MTKHFFRLFKVYQSLSDNQRNNFWLAASNIFLVVFTFWLGLTVQYIVVDNNAKLNAKLIQLEYYRNVSQDYDNLIQQQNRFVNSLIAVPEKSEPTYLLNEFFNWYNDDFQEITSVTDSVIVLANRLRWVISDRKVTKKLDTDILMTTLFNGLLKCSVNNSEIQSQEDLIDAYFKSEFFVNQTHVVTTKDLRKEAINLINDNVEKADNNQQFCLAVLLKIIPSVFDIFEIFNTEIGNISNSDLEKIAISWNDIPTIIKSLVILILLLIIGFFVVNRLLYKMFLPSRNKVYTKEEYNSVNHENKEMGKKIKLLENTLMLNYSIIDMQRKQIKGMEERIEDNDERYIELLTELGEKNRKIKEFEDCNNIK